MIRTNGSLALLLVALGAASCTRRAEVESEPVPGTLAPAAIDIAGLYDYVVPLDNGPDAAGMMTVSRAGAGYAVAFTSNIGDVGARNVRRTGNTLRMDVSTPNGSGTVDVTWQSRDHATGTVFLGEMLEMHITRRP